MVMTSHFEDNLVAVFFHKLEIPLLVIIFLPLSEGSVPPASCLIDVHHCEEFLIWASILQLFFEPVQLSFALLVSRLIIFTIEGQTIDVEKGKLARNKIGTIPATLQQSRFNVAQVFQ